MTASAQVRELVDKYEKLCEEHGFDFVSSLLVEGVAAYMDRRGTDPAVYIRSQINRGVGTLKSGTYVLF